MQNIKVLVIDDERLNIQLIVEILQKLEYDCDIISTSNSTLAMKIALEAKPTIIITDWEMPMMNGIEIITELKKNKQTNDIPIIMATGVKLTSQDLKLALETGAFDFIRKPIDEVELIARISSALRLVDYYNQKLEMQKRELLSKTLILAKIKKAFEEFRVALKEYYRQNKNSISKVPPHIVHLSNEMRKIIEMQIWEDLELHFEQIHETFYMNLLSQCPTLTKNERRLCAYLRLNLSTKDISSLTLQTVRSIEVARIRLRNKLGLKGTSEDLNMFMLRF